MLTPGISKGIATALAVSALGLMAGCGSSSDGSGSSAAATATPAATTASAAETTPASTADASSGSGDAVASTPPGTFALGSKATIAHQEFVNKKFVDAPFELSITKVQEGDISDLKNFDLDAQSKQGTPFYVHATFTNKSDLTYDATGIAGYLTVLNAAGDQSSRLGLIGDFPKCEGSGPKAFKPGASTSTCDVFILPKGQSVAQVYAIDTAAEKYIWKVG